MWLKWNLGLLSTKLGFWCYNEGQFVVARRLYTDMALLPTQVTYVERSIYTCALVCLCCWQWWADCQPYFLPLKQLIVVYLGWRWQTGRVSAWRLSCSEKRLQRRSIIQEEPSSQEGLQQLKSVVCLLGKLQVTMPVISAVTKHRSLWHAVAFLREVHMRASSYAENLLSSLSVLLYKSMAQQCLVIYLYLVYKAAGQRVSKGIVIFFVFNSSFIQLNALYWQP